jgi:hypothetical protein
MKEGQKTDQMKDMLHSGGVKSISTEAKEKNVRTAQVLYIMKGAEQISCHLHTCGKSNWVISLSREDARQD